MATKQTTKKRAKKAVKKAAKPGKKATAPKSLNELAHPKKFDVMTRAGRDALDAATLKQLGKAGKSRGEVAKAVGADPRAVSASLARHEAAKDARSEGERAERRWFRRAAS